MCQERIHSRPHIDPHEANSWERTPTICAIGKDTHSNTFICRIITTMEQSVKNKTGFQQKVSVDEPRFNTLTLKESGPWAEEEEDEEDEYEPSEPLSSLPIIPKGEVMYCFQPQHVRADPSILSAKPQHLTSHTPHPKSLTLSLQAPIPSLLPQKTPMPHL